MAVGGERRAFDLEVGVVLHRDREERVWVRLGGWGGVHATPPAPESVPLASP